MVTSTQVGGAAAQGRAYFLDLLLNDFIEGQDHSRG